MTNPIVKWAGGKRRLLPELLARLPLSMSGTYFEPFAGGAALFFAILPARAVLSDMNEELVTLYRVLRNNPDGMMRELRNHVNTPAHFEQVRRLEPLSLTDEARAARFYYLNHTCFNGLYRVNRKGQFNVPFGKYKSPRLYPQEDVRKVSRALQNASIFTEDFETVCSRAVPGDFIYFDPPYIPVKESSFISYTTDGFTDKDQERLAKLFHSLRERGVSAMLSNSDTKATRELYESPTVQIESLLAPRSISCKAQGRQSVHEVIITNYPVHVSKGK